jgi:hypothetical protein
MLKALQIFLLFATGAFAAEPLDLRAVFKESCTKCHGENEKVKGKVNLLELESVADLKANPELLKDLVEAIDFEEMPPEDEPQLSSEKRQQLLVQLKALLHESVAAQGSIPHTPVRRMNRFQYNNAVQDLFELNVNVFSLPERVLREHGGYFKPETGQMPEKLKVGSRPLGKSQLIESRLVGVSAFPQDLRAEHGYDNRGDHLSLSPLLMESFLKLSRSVVGSRDFNAKTVGIWTKFFASPPTGDDVELVVRERLQDFLSRAFRRPVEDELLDRYAAAVLAQIEAGDSFSEGMKTAASAALASPRFLYLYDQAGSLDDFSLASRLSFFLWGSIPDQSLFDAAAAGKLAKPDLLTAQVDRMLHDRKLKRFCDSFPAQWLQLERIVSSVPDKDRFPKFFFSKYRASMHMMLEPLLLFETILIENQSIIQLIDSDFSYRSSLLENWYRDGKGGRNAVTAIEFNRVPVEDRRQGGVITNAAVMTMTSGPNRTQPITRGAWIANVIFNEPPEPPPADVPPLNEDGEDLEKLTLRERLALHRENASCAGCHEQIDPLGFAMENFGPTGLWRESYENGREVDSSGVLFRKHEFMNVIEFKDALLAEKDRFARAFAGHLLAYALGRETTAADSIALDRIVAETTNVDYAMQDLIKQIVLSEPFRNQSNPKQKAD